ncbi:MAG: serine/threonine protein kinase [Burkholderiales bacterium PBB1]|nr:MAG: serine/threonine protein kinase [Burkholderiales bacterium PBB1]
MTQAFDRDRLGRYRIERLLGRGAMGAVVLGRDADTGRQAAIKTLSLSNEFSADEVIEARARFFREADAARRLQHPDIVTIYDTGQAGPLAYIAMEYVVGHDLQRHTEVGQLLPLPLVVHIGARVAHALAHAHRQGVIHRDVKPANVMIDASAGVVKVTDFGVARIADACRTRTGMLLGTPTYMSPEQLSGLRVDGRTDLYSLGVTLFQLLTGALPYCGESMARLMYGIVNEVAPDVRTLRPDVPQALASVLAQTLAKAPEARYADGLQLAQALDAVAALWPGAPLALPSDVAPATATPEVDTFASTVKSSRPDPGHNSAP